MKLVMPMRIFGGNFWGAHTPGVVRKVLNVLAGSVYVVYMSLELFFLLPLAMCSRLIFDKAWSRYYQTPLEKSIFNLCVQWLLYVGNRVGLSYTQINVLIFCILWPIITISSIVLNVVLLAK